MLEDFARITGASQGSLDLVAGCGYRELLKLLDRAVDAEDFDQVNRILDAIQLDRAYFNMLCGLPPDVLKGMYDGLLQRLSELTGAAGAERGPHVNPNR